MQKIASLILASAIVFTPVVGVSQDKSTSIEFTQVLKGPDGKPMVSSPNDPKSIFTSGIYATNK